MTSNLEPNTSNLIIHTDGGSRGNPGPAATGIVIHSSPTEVLHSFGRYLGIATNNVAEYSAVIDALQWVINSYQSEVISQKSNNELFDLRLKPQDFRLDFNLDSQLVVEQLNRRWKIKDANLFNLAQQIWSLIELNKLTVTFTYVPREQNKLADAEVNKTLDLVGKQ